METPASSMVASFFPVRSSPFAVSPSGRSQTEKGRGKPTPEPTGHLYFCRFALDLSRLSLAEAENSARSMFQQICKTKRRFICPRCRAPRLRRLRTCNLAKVIGHVRAARIADTCSRITIVTAAGCLANKSESRRNGRDSFTLGLAGFEPTIS